MWSFHAATFICTAPANLSAKIENLLTIFRVVAFELDGQIANIGTLQAQERSVLIAFLYAFLCTSPTNAHAFHGLVHFSRISVGKLSF
jgi:hypothetical protein